MGAPRDRGLLSECRLGGNSRRVPTCVRARPEAQARLPDPALQQLFDGLKPPRKGASGLSTIGPALSEAVLRCGVTAARQAGFNTVRYAPGGAVAAALRPTGSWRHRHEAAWDRLLMTVVRNDTTATPDLQVEASSISAGSLVFESHGVEQTSAPRDAKVVADSIHAHCSLASSP